MPTAERSAAHWVCLAAAAACWIALAALGALLEPAPAGHGTHTQLGLPPCRFLELTGLPCPGCGVTTAAVLATHGELARAFATQPFGAALAIAMALFPVWASVQALRGRDLGEHRPAWANRVTLAAAVLLALGAWAYRLIAAA